LDIRLPQDLDLDSCRAVYHSDELWLPAVEEICRRHGLVRDACSRGPDGTHIVYFSGSACVIKLFVPLFGDDFRAERVVLKHLSGALPVSTPEILFEGDVGGWPYLVMSRLDGRSIGEAWSNVDTTGRLRLAEGVGELIRDVRGYPVAGLRDLSVDWPTFVARQKGDCRERHRDESVGLHLLDEIPCISTILRVSTTCGGRRFW
jgi:hygromycin-B 7''-O-kinase